MNSGAPHLLFVVMTIFSLQGSVHSLLAAEQSSRTTGVLDIGSRLELFVDNQLIDTIDGLSLRLHEPYRQPKPKSPLPVNYGTVIKDGDLFRAYYRDYRKGYAGKKFDGNPGEITCYAESKDGHEWSFPKLDIFDIEGSMGRNVIWSGGDKCSHNFSPFLDIRRGVPKKQKFKALAGIHPDGVFAFESEDGIHWKKIQDKAVISSEKFAFDSQSIAFWSVVENAYVCYFRSWQTPHGKLRTISRTTSKDFLNWTEAIATNPNLPGEHLYTSQLHPYFRAPHIYIAIATRFMQERGSSTDLLFMSSRAGSARFDRLFTEAFIRPGMDEERWGNRSNYAALNIVPTARGEMSIYHKDGYRYALRTDGFISVNAGADKGEFLTKPVRFLGSQLRVNYSTSAAGSLQVEIQDKNGAVLPGFQLADCKVLTGDNIEQRVAWKGTPDLAGISNKPVRLRFVMTEADLYSLKFSD